MRSMLWSFGSPSLVVSNADNRWQSDEWCSWRALELAGLLEKPDLARQLDEFLDSENDHRLGARFERLIEYGLQHLPGVECVKRRLQVYEQKQTLGEFDFIIKDSVDELEHWEVACKFYLGVPDHRFSGEAPPERATESTPIHWVGPGKRDSLIRKLKHLTLKQLVLSLRPEASPALEALGGDIARVRALLKGRLFYPLDCDHVHDVLFEFDTPQGSLKLNPHAPSGYWCDFDELKAAKPQFVYALGKPQWLDPATDRRQELSIEELAGQIETTPQCIGVVTQNGELQRWFIVRKGWFDDLDPKAIR